MKIINDDELQVGLKLYQNLMGAAGGTNAIVRAVTSSSSITGISTDHLDSSPFKAYLDRFISKIPIKVKEKKGVSGTWGYTGQGKKRFKTVVSDDRILIIDARSYQEVYVVDVFNQKGSLRQSYRIMGVGNTYVEYWGHSGPLEAPEGEDYATVTILVDGLLAVLTNTEVIVIDLGTGSSQDFLAMAFSGRKLMVGYDCFTLTQLLNEVGLPYTGETGMTIASNMSVVAISTAMSRLAKNNPLTKDPGLIFT